MQASKLPTPNATMSRSHTISEKEIEEIKKLLRAEIRAEYNTHFANITFLLFLSYLWETVEHYFEVSGIPLLQQVFQGTEYWGNRIIADSLCVII